MVTPHTSAGGWWQYGYIFVRDSKLYCGLCFWFLLVLVVDSSYVPCERPASLEDCLLTYVHSYEAARRGDHRLSNLANRYSSDPTT